MQVFYHRILFPSSPLPPLTPTSSLNSYGSWHDSHVTFLRSFYYSVLFYSFLFFTPRFLSPFLIFFAFLLFPTHRSPHDQVARVRCSGFLYTALSVCLKKKSFFFLSLFHRSLPLACNLLRACLASQLSMVHALVECKMGFSLCCTSN